MTRLRLPLLRPVIAGLSVLMAGGFAASDALAVNKKVERACRSDFKRLCPSYNPNSTSGRACMESKSGEISSRCMDALIETGEIDKKRVAKR